jgi:hypothetical protein
MRGSPDGNFPNGEKKPPTSLRRESAFLREMDLHHLVGGGSGGSGGGGAESVSSDGSELRGSSPGSGGSGKKKLGGHKIDEGDHYKHHLYGKMATEVTNAVTQNTEIKKANKELTAKVRRHSRAPTECHNSECRAAAASPPPTHTHTSPNPYKRAPRQSSSPHMDMVVSASYESTIRRRHRGLFSHINIPLSPTTTI